MRSRGGGARVAASDSQWKEAVMRLILGLNWVGNLESFRLVI